MPGRRLPRHHRPLRRPPHRTHEGRAERPGPRGTALLTALLGATLWAAWPATAAGHDGEPAVDVLPNRAQPGDAVRLVGDDLQPGEMLELRLLTADGELELGRSEVTSEGHVDTTFTVPSLDPRIYELRVTDAAGLAISTYLTIPGPDDLAPEPPAGGFLPAIVLGIVGLAVLVVALTGTSGRRRREGRGRPRTST